MRHTAVWLGITLSLLGHARLMGAAPAFASAPPTFQRVALPNTLIPGVTAITDATGDGQLDIISPGPSGIFVLPGNGSGKFPNWLRGEDDIFMALYPAAADFNGDGILDLVVGGVSNPGAFPSNFLVRAFLGEPGGRFRPVFNLAADSTSGPKTGDFNGDGYADFVFSHFESYLKPPGIATYSRSVMEVFLSDGQGGFVGPIRTLDGSSFAGVFFAADVNADGKADVFTVSSDDRTLDLWLADGTGAFQSRQPLTPPALPSDRHPNSSPPTPAGIVQGDLNGDGRRDLLVRFRYSARSSEDRVHGEPREFSVFYLGDGTGRFGPPVPLVEPRDHWRTVVQQAIGDVNGDGRPDIVLSGPNAFKTGPLFGLQPATDVYLGSGGGLFTGPILSPRVGGMFSYASDNSARLRDVDGDGLTDLLTSDSIGGLVIAHGDGAGHFTRSSVTGNIDNYWAGGTSTSDFNNDHNPDVVVANAGSHSVSVWLGDGKGSWSGPVTYATGDNHAPVGLASADFDGDGNVDLATASTSFRGATPGISILTGDGTGRLTLSRQLLAGEPVALVAADFDRDGTMDLAAANNGVRTVDIFFDMPGKTRRETVIDWTNPEDGADGVLAGLAAADFDRNGLIDLVRSSASGTVSVFLNPGNAALARTVQVPMGGVTYNVAAGDLDGDGAPDIAVVGYENGSGVVDVVRGDGAGGFGPRVQYYLGADVPAMSIAIADLDGHGQRAVITNLYTGLHVLLADATGQLAPPIRYVNDSTSGMVHNLAVADVNRDGLLDAVLPHEIFTNLGVCGNGKQDANEECDDGNNRSCDGCSATCRREIGGVCGDGIVNSSCAEECDAGAENSDQRPDACRTACRLPRCGDGVIDAGEECDDGNTTSCDGCSAACTFDPPPVCGDGIVNNLCSEECDDGGRSDGDGCSSRCGLELIPGGGPMATDCFIEWVVANPGNTPRFDRKGYFSNKQACRDNDPSCDFDGGVSGSCTFHVTACVNMADPDLWRCRSTSLASYEIVRPSVNQASASAALGTLRAQIDAMTNSIIHWPAGRCSMIGDVTIPVGKQRITTRAVSLAHQRDADTIVFACLP